MIQAREHESAQPERTATSATLLGARSWSTPTPIYVWLPGSSACWALAELLWRSDAWWSAFAVGHIGATLLVAVGLTAA